MNALEKLNSMIEKDDLFSTLNYVEDKKATLLHLWVDDDHEKFENALRLAIQESESIKNWHPSFNCSIQYHFGRLDGYTEIFESLFREKEHMRSIKQSLIGQTAKARQILQCLYQNGRMCHGDLADAVGSSYSSLSNIMKKVLLSGAVDSMRSGKNTYYSLTEIGRQYCKQTQHNKEQNEEIKKELTTLIKVAVEESMKSMQKTNDILGEKTVAQKKQQSISASEEFIPVYNHEYYPPLEVVSIENHGDKKYVELREPITNAEEWTGVSIGSMAKSRR